MDNPLHICVLVLPEVAVAFKREKNQTWKDYVIKGEASYYHNQKATTLQDILGDINDRLFRNDKKLLNVQVSLVYAPACRHLMESSIKTLHSLACEQWQILAWQSLYQQAATLNNSKLDDKVPSLPWIKSHILPLLGYDAELERLRQKEHANALRAIEDEKQDLNSQQQTAKQSHAQMLAALEAEKNKLLQELQELKQQQNILAQPNLEQLLSFLPAIFKDFWNKVRPDELANIAGSINTPNIPSPYFSPSQPAIIAKKRQFLQLAAVDQQQIKRFCIEMIRNYPLEMHSEFVPIMEGD